MLTDETLDSKKMVSFVPKFLKIRTLQFDFMPGALDDLMVDRLQLGLIVFAALWRIVLFRSHLQVKWTFSLKY